MRKMLKPEPKLGDIRRVTKFLFLPKVINDELRWLEKATYRQMYEQVLNLSSSGTGLENIWYDMSWVDDYDEKKENK
jgi:hypothetical protein